MIGNLKRIPEMNIGNGESKIQQTEGKTGITVMFS